MKSNKKRTKVVRRSVALPDTLVTEAVAVAASTTSNFNRLVIIALEEFVERRRKQAFANAIANMSADPEIQRQSRKITTEFLPTELDGINPELNK